MIRKTGSVAHSGHFVGVPGHKEAPVRVVTGAQDLVLHCRLSFLRGCQGLGHVHLGLHLGAAGVPDAARVVLGGPASNRSTVRKDTSWRPEASLRFGRLDMGL